MARPKKNQNPQVIPAKYSGTGLTLAQVESADHRQLAYWWRFLPNLRTGDEVSDLLVSRFKALGGMTPELSKSIGWDEPKK